MTTTTPLMKFNTLRRKLLRESAMLGGTIAVIAAIAFYLNMAADNFVTSNATLQTDVTTVSGEKDKLKKAYSSALKNGNLYQEYLQKDAKGEMTLNRDALRDVFDKLTNRFNINRKSMKLSMGNITEMTDAKYKRPYGVIVGSTISIGVEALSDRDVFSLVQGFQSSLNGSQKVTSFTVTKQSALTNDVLHKISVEGFAPLVKADIQFQWLGIKPLEPSNRTDNAPKKP